MTTPEPTRLFDVEVTVVAHVSAQNAGEAIEALCESVRLGLGPDDPERRAADHHNATIAHGRATVTSVVIPEKRP